MQSQSQLFALLLLSALVSLAAAALHAKIESCSGWALNKMPELKSFLKDGEAESYHNVEVKFIHGRKAIMTIYESGDGEESWVEKEKIVLSDYKTKVWTCCVALRIIWCAYDSHISYPLFNNSDLFTKSNNRSTGGNACINGRKGVSNWYHIQKLLYYFVPVCPHSSICVHSIKHTNTALSSNHQEK